MRKTVLVALSSMLLGVGLVAPVSAQGAPTAGGSCGYAAGSYGMNSLSPLDIRNPNRGTGGNTVNRVQWQAEYANVPVGSRVQVLTVLNDDLTNGSTTAGVQSVEATGGTIAGAFATGGEQGATRTGKRGTSSNAGHGKQGSTSSAGATGATGMYYFYVWANGQQIGKWTCAVADY